MGTDTYTLSLVTETRERTFVTPVTVVTHVTEPNAVGTI
jgi:hypothetical protein